MVFALQHGYGKADKLEEVARGTRVSSVILSPTDEEPGNLELTAARVRALGARSLLDPQTYLYSEPVGFVGRCHDSHRLALSPIRWSQPPRDVEKVLHRVEAANAAIGIEEIIAPSVLQPSFGDIWTPLGIQYARAAADMWSGRKVYASAVFNEQAFSSWDLINNWLDEITTIDLSGFYLLTNNNSPLSYPATTWDSYTLSNVLRLIYTLTEINDFELIWGYSDLEGILGVAVGATEVATGWHNSLRRFSVDKWRPRDGGSPAIPRKFIYSLLTPVRLEGEADRIEELSNLQLINSGSDAMFESFMDSNESWARGISQKHHMVSIGELANSLTGLSVPDRLDAVSSWVEQAINTFGLIERNNLVFDSQYVRKLMILRDAIAIFRNEEGI